jgi:hypothetical protein
MNEEKLLLEMVDTIPQWYGCACGPHLHGITVNAVTLPFATHRDLSGPLATIHEYVEGHLERWHRQLPAIPTTLSFERLRRRVVLRWLAAHDPEVEWERLFAWADEIALRTHENENVAMNVRITAGEGRGFVTEGSLQTGLDLLGRGSRTYLQVDKRLRFLDLEEIRWETVRDREFKFHPEFLHPFVSILGEGEWSFHITQAGDVVVLDQEGLMASRRKGRWFIYDGMSLRDAFIDIMKTVTADDRTGYRVGANLLEVCLDLSYDRHGALLVYDPRHTVLEHVANPTSIIAGPEPNPRGLHAMLAPRVGCIPTAASSQTERKKRVFAELASLDGATVFDDRHVLAFGAMVRTHPLAGEHFGARTTAAYSAYRWGGVPMKISADGEITVLFPSQDGASGVVCDAALAFL